MVKKIFPVSISNFLSIRRKTSKIIYTEISYIIKLVSSIIIVFFYKPMSINLIIFFIFFLLLVYTKLYKSSYITYKKVSGNVILMKFLLLVCILILGKNNTYVEPNNQTIYSLEPNLLVDLKRQPLISQRSTIKQLLNKVNENCIKSIYRIEVTSLLSIIVSQLLVISIQPQTVLHFLDQLSINISTRSNINLVFTFSSQIYFLISDQITKIVTAIRCRSSNHSVSSIFNHKKIVDFLFLYGLKKRYNLKQDVMTSAQINSNKLIKAQYVNLKTKKILFYSDKMLIALTGLIICFLVSV
nr:hypothetical protein [Erythrotrichia welwitschii]